MGAKNNYFENRNYINKNTKQPRHAAYTIPHPRVLPCLHNLKVTVKKG